MNKKPEWPIGQIESNYYCRFALGVGIAFGSILDSFQEGLIMGALVIVVALLIKMYREGNL